MNSFSTHAQYRTDASARSPSYGRHTIARSPPLCSRQLRVRQSRRPADRRGDDRHPRPSANGRVQAHVSWSVRSLIEYRQPWRFPCCHHLPNVCPYTCTRRVGDRAARHDHSRAQEEDGRGAHHGNRTDILPYIVTSQHDAEHIHSCARSSGSTSPPRPPCRSSRAPPACRPHRRRTVRFATFNPMHRTYSKAVAYSLNSCDGRFLRRRCALQVRAQPRRRDRAERAPPTHHSNTDPIGCHSNLPV